MNFNADSNFNVIAVVIFSLNNESCCKMIKLLTFNMSEKFGCLAA